MEVDSVPPTTVPSARDDAMAIEEKKVAEPETTTTVRDGDVELHAADEPEKTYYSKLSVWLMVLFSGLAIGSDG